MFIISNLPTGLCLLLGMALIVLEVFLPGFGLPGISGIALIGVGVALIGAQFGALPAVAVLLVLIAILAAVISWVLRQAAHGKMHAKLFLQERDELHGQEEDMQVLIGKRGTTTSVLRPAGIGDFDGVRLNVVTEGSFIEKDMPIEIVRVEGSRIVVRTSVQV